VDIYLHSIFACTKAIAFFGTPHSGSGLEQWVRWANISRTRVQQEDLEVIGRIQADFHNLIRSNMRSAREPIKITCFYENLQTTRFGYVSQSFNCVTKGTSPNSTLSYV
jgi:hypothetical protein